MEVSKTTCRREPVSVVGIINRLYVPAEVSFPFIWVPPVCFYQVGRKGAAGSGGSNLAS